MKNKKDNVQLTLRIPEYLYQELQDIAECRGYSVNELIIFRLTEKPLCIDEEQIQSLC